MTLNNEGPTLGRLEPDAHKNPGEIPELDDALIETLDDPEAEKEKSSGWFGRFNEKAKRFVAVHVRGEVDQREKDKQVELSKAEKAGTVTKQLAGGIIGAAATIGGWKSFYDIPFGVAQNHFTAKERKSLLHEIREAMSGTENQEGNTVDNPELAARFSKVQSRIEASLHLTSAQKQELLGKLKEIMDTDQAERQATYEERNKEIEDLINTMLADRVSRTQMATELTNTALAGAQLWAVRGTFMLGTSALKAYQEARKELKESNEEAEFLETVQKSFIDSYTRLKDDVVGREGDTWTQRSMGRVKALGKVARVGGFGWMASTGFDSLGDQATAFMKQMEEGGILEMGANYSRSIYNTTLGAPGKLVEMASNLTGSGKGVDTGAEAGPKLAGPDWPEKGDHPKPDMPEVEAELAKRYAIEQAFKAKAELVGADTETGMDTGAQDTDIGDFEDDTHVSRDGELPAGVSGASMDTMTDTAVDTGEEYDSQESSDTDTGDYGAVGTGAEIDTAIDTSAEDTDIGDSGYDTYNGSDSEVSVDTADAIDTAVTPEDSMWSGETADTGYGEEVSVDTGLDTGLEEVLQDSVNESAIETPFVPMGPPNVGESQDDVYPTSGTTDLDHALRDIPEVVDIDEDAAKVESAHEESFNIDTEELEEDMDEEGADDVSAGAATVGAVAASVAESAEADIEHTDGAGVAEDEGGVVALDEEQELAEAEAEAEAETSSLEEGEGVAGDADEEVAEIESADDEAFDVVTEESEEGEDDGIVEDGSQAPEDLDDHEVDPSDVPGAAPAKEDFSGDDQFGMSVEGPDDSIESVLAPEEELLDFANKVVENGASFESIESYFGDTEKAVALGLVRDHDGISQAIARQIDEMPEDKFQGLLEKYGLKFNGERSYDASDKAHDHVRTGPYKSLIAKLTGAIVAENGAYDTETGAAQEGFSKAAVGEMSAVLVGDPDSGFSIKYVDKNGAEFNFDGSPMNEEGSSWKGAGSPEGRSVGSSPEAPDVAPDNRDLSVVRRIVADTQYELGGQSVSFSPDGAMLIDGQPADMSVEGARALADTHKNIRTLTERLYDAKIVGDGEAYNQALGELNDIAIKYGSDSPWNKGFKIDFPEGTFVPFESQGGSAVDVAAGGGETGVEIQDSAPKTVERGGRAWTWEVKNGSFVYEMQGAEAPRAIEVTKDGANVYNTLANGRNPFAQSQLSKMNNMIELMRTMKESGVDASDGAYLLAQRELVNTEVQLNQTAKAFGLDVKVRVPDSVRTELGLSAVAEAVEINTGPVNEVRVEMIPGSGEKVLLRFERDASGNVSGINYGPWKTMRGDALTAAEKFARETTNINLDDPKIRRKFLPDVKKLYALFQTELAMGVGTQEGTREYQFVKDQTKEITAKLLKAK